MFLEILSILNLIFAIVDTSEYWYAWLIASVVLAIVGAIKEYIEWK